MTSNLPYRTLVESDLDASTLLPLIASTIMNEEERECLFHTQIWVKNDPLRLIVDNISRKNFFHEDIVKKLGLLTTPHREPYNISWMKDGKKLRITWQCRLSYFIKPFEDELLSDVALLFVANTLFGKAYLWDRHNTY